MDKAQQRKIQIWKAKVPLKVTCFTWLLAKEAVLTRDNLRKRNNIQVTHCSLCGEATEIVRHFLWKIFINLRGIQRTMPCKVVDTLSTWKKSRNWGKEQKLLEDHSSMHLVDHLERKEC